MDDFENFENQQIFVFIKSANFFVLFLFYNVYKENMFIIEIEDMARSALSLVSLNIS